MVLAVEEQFYIFWPFAIFILENRADGQPLLQSLPYYMQFNVCDVLTGEHFKGLLRTDTLIFQS